MILQLIPIMRGIYAMLAAAAVGFLIVGTQDNIHVIAPEASVHQEIRPSVTSIRIKEAVQFTRKKNFDTTVTIFIDYGLHSGKKRGFVINLQNGLASDSFLVSHGCGPYSWGSDQSKDKPEFSNALESHCSSIGKYKIGKRAYSSWGIHVKYLMFGLDSSNSNAYKRTIVLHGWGDIPDNDVYPAGIPEGWGCPAVSDKSMTRLDSLLQSKKRPVLMWIYR